jgi:cell division protein FtsQ
MVAWIKRHLFTVFGLIAFLGLMAIGLYILYFTDTFVLKEIKVQNNHRINKEEIIKLTGLKGGERLFRIDLKELERKLKSHPLIEEVIIARRLPSSLEISLKEREGLAILVRGQRGYLIDKKGVIIGGVLPNDYLFYPVVEIENEKWKETYLAFLSWIKVNKNYLPVFENLSKITITEDKVIFITKNHITIYFPLSLMEDWIALYKHLDRIMVYLYEKELIDRVELIRMDYPYGKALIKFRS